jgi:hypothetical protein
LVLGEWIVTQLDVPRNLGQRRRFLLLFNTSDCSAEAAESLSLANEREGGQRLRRLLPGRGEHCGPLVVLQQAVAVAVELNQELRVPYIGALPAGHPRWHEGHGQEQCRES